MPPLSELEQAALDMQKRYRNVFSSAEGRKVLGDILTMGHFGVPLNPDDPIRLGEHSMAITIARMAGAFDPIFQHLDMKENTDGRISPELR